MKKIVVSVSLIVGIAAYVHGQGTILLGNFQNSSLDSTATSNGLVWTNDGKGGIGLWDGMNNNLSIEILAGPSTDALGPLLTFDNSYNKVPLGVIREDAVQAAGDFTGYYYGQFVGTWNSILTLTVPNITPGGIAWIHLKLWWSAGGPVAPTYEAAKTDGHSFFGEALFQQPTGNPLASPPGLPKSLTAMPAIVLMVPEPGVFALAGLGLAGLLIFRRRV